MKSRKFFEEDLANTKPGGSCEKATFGANRPGRSQFGRDSLPQFGLAPLARDERGVAIIEYALICALIAVAILVSLGRLGGSVGRNFNSVDNEVSNAIVFRT